MTRWHLFGLLYGGAFSLPVVDWAIRMIRRG